MKFKDIIIIILAIALAISFFIKKGDTVVVDNKVNTKLKLRGIWDTIDYAEYKAEYKIYTDSIRYYKTLAKESKEKGEAITRKYYSELSRIDTNNTKLLSTYYDNYVGTKIGKTVKEIDSNQLVNSVKLFVEVDYSKDRISELMNENNYLTLVSTTCEEALDISNKEVIALNDTLANRNIENAEYVVTNNKECDKRVKKLKRENTWTKIIAGTVVVGIAVAAIFSSAL